MNLEWLEDFAVLVETRNFSRAAARRNVTQPAFSRRIRALEEWLGAPLFTRTPHNVSVTYAGEKILAEAEAIVRAAHRMRAVAARAGSPEKLTIQFAATHSLSFSFFPVWIKDFAQVLGQAAVNLISDTMASCEQALITGQARFLLCHDSAAAPSRFAADHFLSAAVGGDTLTPYAAPNGKGLPLWNLDAPGMPVRWLRYSPESGFFRMMANHPLITARLADADSALTSRLATVLLSMAEDGRGIAWLPASLAGPAEAQGRLVRAGGERWDIPMSIRLFRDKEKLGDTAELFWKTVAGKGKGNGKGNA